MAPPEKESAGTEREFQSHAVSILCLCVFAFMPGGPLRAGHGRPSFGPWTDELAKAPLVAATPRRVSVRLRTRAPGPPHRTCDNSPARGNALHAEVGWNRSRTRRFRLSLKARFHRRRNSGSVLGAGGSRNRQTRGLPHSGTHASSFRLPHYQQRPGRTPYHNPSRPEGKESGAQPTPGRAFC